MDSVRKVIFNKSRRIGVEFEVEFVSPTTARRIVSQIDPDEKVFAKVTTDASLSSYSSSEIITLPIKVTKNNIQIMFSVFESIIRNENGHVTGQCGTHIHMSARPKLQRNVANIAKSFKIDTLFTRFGNSVIWDRKSMCLRHIFLTYYLSLEMLMDDMSFILGRSTTNYARSYSKAPKDKYPLEGRYFWASFADSNMKTIEYRLPRYVIPEQYAYAIKTLWTIHWNFFKLLKNIADRGKYDPLMMKPLMYQNVKVIKANRDALAKIMKDVGILKRYEKRLPFKFDAKPIHESYAAKVPIDKSVENAYNILKTLPGRNL